MNSNPQSLSTVAHIHLAQRQDPAMVVAHLTHSLRSPLASLTQRNEVAKQVEALSYPASPVWILARVAALLNPYYEKDTPQAIREIEAEDWLAALEGKPEWAITAAVRWWLGESNDKRRSRPLQGDIAARVSVETEALRAGSVRVRAFDAGMLPRPTEPERKMLTVEERRAIAVSHGMPDLSGLAKPFPATGETTP